VLIETLSAAFEMDEILFELKDHCAGLNAGRWDYMFSIIKTYRSRGKRHVLPDRDQLVMTLPFMRAYTNLLVKTCHRRGAHAIGGMSAFIPNRQLPEVTEAALEKVALDKRREAQDGFDGSWVAHPGLIDVARAEFDAILKGQPNQLNRQRPDVTVAAEDLLDFSSAGSRVTEAGVRHNISITIRYVEAWLRGHGAVALDNLMEDAATAEISRSLIWQWINQRVVTVENTEVTRALVTHFMEDIVEQLPRPDGHRVDDAVAIFQAVALSDEYPTFLTIPAYAQYLVASTREPALTGA
jgi:malate synthase